MNSEHFDSFHISKIKIFARIVRKTIAKSDFRLYQISHKFPWGA